MTPDHVTLVKHLFIHLLWAFPFIEIFHSRHYIQYVSLIANINHLLYHNFISSAIHTYIQCNVPSTLPHTYHLNRTHTNVRKRETSLFCTCFVSLMVYPYTVKGTPHKRKKKKNKRETKFDCTERNFLASPAFARRCLYIVGSLLEQALKSPEAGLGLDRGQGPCLPSVKDTLPVGEFFPIRSK